MRQKIWAVKGWDGLGMRAVSLFLFHPYCWEPAQRNQEKNYLSKQVFALPLMYKHEQREFLDKTSYNKSILRFSDLASTYLKLPPSKERFLNALQH